MKFSMMTYTIARGMLRDGAGKVFIAERVDRQGFWQFQQGGVDEGETLEEALARELREEISVDAAAYEIVTRKGPYYYLFGNGKEVKGYHGKEQHYFLMNFTGDAGKIDVGTEHPEFRDGRWVEPGGFEIDWLPKMKREVYREVFRDFFAVEI